MEEKEFAVKVTLEEGYRMSVDFGAALPSLTIDEPAPLGNEEGPNPSRLLASAVGGCLGASMLFCLRRSRAEVQGLSVDVEGRMHRNERGRWRIAGMTVKLAPELSADEHDRLSRCMGLFEDYCIVTESVRRGIPIEVEVHPVLVPAQAAAAEPAIAAAAEPAIAAAAEPAIEGAAEPAIAGAAEPAA